MGLELETLMECIVALYADWDRNVVVSCATHPTWVGTAVSTPAEAWAAECEHRRTVAQGGSVAFGTLVE